MEKGTREVKCPNCLPEVTKIVVPVTTKDYGKAVKVRCTKCQTDFSVEIPIPTRQPQGAPGGFPFGDIFGDLFGGTNTKK